MDAGAAKAMLEGITKKIKPSGNVADLKDCDIIVEAIIEVTFFVLQQIRISKLVSLSRIWTLKRSSLEI